MQRALVAYDLGFEVFFPIVTNGVLPRASHLHTDSNPEGAPRFVLKLKRFEILMNRVGDLPYGDRLCVFDLFRSEEGVLRAAMPTIRAVARSRPFDSGTGRNFKIAEARFDGAFPADVRAGRGNLDRTISGVSA
jgi:hypothetical protein